MYYSQSQTPKYGKGTSKVSSSYYSLTPNPHSWSCGETLRKVPGGHWTSREVAARGNRLLGSPQASLSSWIRAGSSEQSRAPRAAGAQKSRDHSKLGRGSSESQGLDRCSFCPPPELGLAIFLLVCLESAERSPEPTTASQPSSLQVSDTLGSGLAGSNCC